MGTYDFLESPRPGYFQGVRLNREVNLHSSLDGGVISSRRLLRLVGHKITSYLQGVLWLYEGIHPALESGSIFTTFFPTSNNCYDQNTLSLYP